MPLPATIPVPQSVAQELRPANDDDDDDDDQNATDVNAHETITERNCKENVNHEIP